MMKLENKTVNTSLIELDCQQSTNTEFKDLDDFILILWMKLIPWDLKYRVNTKLFPSFKLIVSLSY